MARWNTIILDVHEIFLVLNLNIYFSIKLKEILQLKIDSSRKIGTDILEDVTINLDIQMHFFPKMTLVKEDYVFRCLYPCIFTFTHKVKPQKT